MWICCTLQLWISVIMSADAMHVFHQHGDFSGYVFYDWKRVWAVYSWKHQELYQNLLRSIQVTSGTEKTCPYGIIQSLLHSRSSAWYSGEWSMWFCWSSYSQILTASLSQGTKRLMYFDFINEKGIFHQYHSIVLIFLLNSSLIFDEIFPFHWWNQNTPIFVSVSSLKWHFLNVLAPWVLWSLKSPT